ncbi:MAG: SCO family protein [Chitinophagaceae bacterium]|nr:MAG: SCO family protein [Chitinophagaceae bacterium]
MKNILFKILPALLLSVSLFSCSKNDMQGDKGNMNKAQKTMSAQKESIAQNSLYQLSGDWTNQYGKEVSLNQLTGKVQVTAMIFTHCGYACPKMVDNMKAIEEKLPKELKNKVDFLLISFDSKNDTSARLNQYAAQKQLDDSWTLLHGSSDQVRMLSMLLQIQYAPLQGGGFNHSNAITILDKEGGISQRIEGLEINVDQAVNAVKEAVNRS